MGASAPADLRPAPLAAVQDAPDSAEWPLWSTTARLVVLDPGRLDEAYQLITGILADVDRAASRFREDSELSRANRDAGRPRQVSPLLADLVLAGLGAAARTGGDVDPTLGTALAAVGYDRDVSLLARTDATGGTAAGESVTRTAPRIVVQRRASWRDVRLDRLTLTVPEGIGLDLGATAKARAADLCAAAVSTKLGTGALVSLGGDIATAGPAPDGGWRILVSDGTGQPEAKIALASGSAVATSSTIRRAWMHAGQPVHHILDPVTQLPAEPVWRTVTVAADSCLDANILTTAAMVRGLAARSWLAGLGVAARLVTASGEVVALGGWPRS